MILSLPDFELKWIEMHALTEKQVFLFFIV